MISNAFCISLLYDLRHDSYLNDCSFGHFTEHHIQDQIERLIEIHKKRKLYEKNDWHLLKRVDFPLFILDRSHYIHRSKDKDSKNTVHLQCFDVEMARF